MSNCRCDPVHGIPGTTLDATGRRRIGTSRVSSRIGLWLLRINRERSVEECAAARHADVNDVRVIVAIPRPDGGDIHCDAHLGVRRKIPKREGGGVATKASEHEPIGVVRRFRAWIDPYHRVPFPKAGVSL